MAKPGKGKTMVSVTAPDELLAIVDARAEALGWSRAKFALAILETWQAEGSKPVNKIDATMAPEVMAKLAASHAKTTIRKAS